MKVCVCVFECFGFKDTLDIPSMIKCICNKAFYNCSGFTKLKMNENLISINEFAFYNCSGFKGSLIITSTVEFIGPYSFSNCFGFSELLILSKNLKGINRNAFYGCSNLTGSLFIPNSVEVIDTYSFYGCSGFNENLSLPSSIEKIGPYAFTSTRFSNIFFEGNDEPDCDSDIGLDRDQVIYVYKNYKSNYFCHFNTSKLDSSSPESKNKLKTYHIVLIVCGAIVFIAAIVIIVCCICRRRRNQQPGINPANLID